MSFITEKIWLGATEDRKLWIDLITRVLERHTFIHREKIKENEKDKEKKRILMRWFSKPNF